SPLIMYMTSSLGSLWNSLRNSRPRATNAMLSGACHSTVLGLPDALMLLITCPRSTAFISSIASPLDAEQLRRGPAEDRRLVVVAQSAGAQDQVHGGLRPRVREIGADQQLAHADFGGQVHHAFRIEHHRVVVHLLEVFRGLLPDRSV